MSEPRSPELEDLLEDFTTFRLNETYVMRPGIVQSYDAAKNKVDVRLALLDVLRSLDDKRTTEEFIVLKGVPVAFPRVGKAFITFPIAVDDRVMVLFADKDLGTFLASTSAIPVDPQDTTPHPLSGAVAYPGLYPDAQALNANTSHLVLGTDSDSTKVLIGDNDEGSMQFVALAQKVLDELTSIKNTFNSHTHNVVFGACTAGGTTGSAPTGAGPVYTPNSVAAVRVKAK